MPNDTVVSALKTALRGELIQRSDPQYEEVRKLYNGMIDKRPLLIARCRDAADVMTAVRFGRENNLLTAIRGGGHNGPGLGSCNDGLVIDFSLMHGVRVDPSARTIRGDGGCTQGDLDHAGHAFGLAVPAGIVTSTGIAGLTLGGGHGYLTRRYGLTIDNLIEADVVLADGTFVTANVSEHEDLFWALRGGGGNFGAVTSFKFQAHPVSTVYAGPVFWDLKHARQIAQWYREFIPRQGVELNSFLAFKTVPPLDPFPREHWGKKTCALITCYSGPLEKGEEAVKPIRQELPKPFFDWMGPMPFPALQALFDPLLPKGLQWYWKGDFFKELPEKAIDVHIEHSAKSPSGMCIVHLYPIDGAVHKVRPDATAWTRRDAMWSMVIAAISPDPAQAADLATWAKAYWSALHPYSMGSTYLNFAMEEGDDRIKATYGSNYPRLAAIKKKYDPTNFFRVNQNIKPA
jgi:FAD/FMN-containing dehydrogenase